MKQNRVIIAGTRIFNDYLKLEQEVLSFIDLHQLKLEDIEIVSGGCRGSDQLGEQFAEKFHLPIQRFLPDWSKGKIAGPLRNKDMAEYGTHLICFWDGESKGTKGMCKVALREGLKVKVVRYGKGESLSLF